MAKNRKQQNKHHHAGRADRSAGLINPDSDLYKYALSVFRERSNQFQKNGDSISVVYEGLDFDTMRLKRRVEAVTAVSKEVKTRFSNLCPDIPGRFSILEDWVGMNAYPYSAYDYVEKYVFSSFAAAIWILDYIRDHGKLEKLNQLLASVSHPAKVLMPDVWDPCHSQQMLSKMVSIITNRNQDQLAAKKRNKQEHTPILRVYMDKATAEHGINHAMPSRSVYDQVLSLIDSDALAAIKERYTERYWEWLRRYFNTRKRFVAEELRIRSQIDEFQNQLLAVAEQIPALPNPSRKAPLFAQATPTVSVAANGYEPSPEYLIRKKHLEQQNRVLYQKQEEFNARFNAFTREVGDFALIPHEILARKYGTDIADCWSEFIIDDPYSMCMAFLVLLDEGSDLPWCYFPGVSLQSCYVCMLPWTRTRYTDSCDGIWDHFDPDAGSIVYGPANEPLPKKIRLPDVDPWYQLKYHNSSMKDSENQTLYSLSHILYETTGCIMPRNLERYQSALSTWNQYGINSKKANLNLLYCMSLLGEAKHRSEMTHFPACQNSSDAEAVPDDIETLQAELIRCREALRNASTEIDTEKKRHSELLEKLSRRDQEIQDLCNTVFRTVDSSPALGVKFPYRTASQIIVFGTDKAWLKKMEAMVPDVVFQERWSRGVVDLIRKADVVWVQPENMFHGDFRSIMSEVRKFDGTLRLFPNSNISECASMLAKADIASC